MLAIEIGSAGEVEDVRPIFDRLASGTDIDIDAIRAEAVERIKSIKFPAAASPTKATIPLMF